MKSKSKKKSTEVSYKIHKIYGYLDEAKTMMYASISWNDGEPRDEVRRCWKTSEGETKLGKGIAITEDEIRSLKKLADEKPAPVNFESIFESSNAIIERRDMGHTTKDGYIVLKPKPGFNYGK